jgi:serine/threonine protein kinase
MAVCLRQELIESYVAGVCSEDQTRTVEEHLSRCENCRQRTDSARANTIVGESSGSAASEGATGGDDEKSRVKEGGLPTVSITDTSQLSHAAPGVDPSLASAIEGYELLERLPAGGQAVVYKAFQKATKRIVAVKVLLQELHASERAQYRFEREVDLAASLRHPNIVTIYDSGIAQGQYYYAMEYIEGKLLDKYVQAGQLPTREVMELFNKICSAVAYAHQRGVMHRDLKPGNILVDADGQPHILDFGLAKLTDSSEKATPEAVMTSIPGKIIGTLAFMSPEQASGNPAAIDVRTDVYSIGVILYRVLTNNFPYEITGSMLGILRNIQEVEPARPSILVGNLNSEIEAILLKALAKEPEYRYQSAAQLQHDIANWLGGLPISAKADSSIYVLRKLLARHRYATAVAGLLLVIILSASYTSFDQYTVAKKALKESQASLKRSMESERKSLSALRRLLFAGFLEAWHKGQKNEARKRVDYIGKGYKEEKAAHFLLDPRPLAEKEPEFRRLLSKDQTGFVDLVIGEHHLKDGNHEAALKAYQNSYKILRGNPDVDMWIVRTLRARLDELTAGDEPAENISTVGGGD